ncbi:MAG: 30S ribosomal protein S2 [Pseudomonadota bacterium]
MQLPNVTMQELLQAGIHFGHVTRRWNPKMQDYIFGTKNGVHIIDLSITLPLMRHAIQAVYDVASRGGRVLFVGTKRQAQKPILEAAQTTGQYYVNHRWLGGMMTNWKTITGSIHYLNNLDKTLNDSEQPLIKKERLNLERKRNKLDLTLGGIRQMPDLPNILVIIDVVKESIAVQEAKKLNIPIVGIVDTNACPDDIDYPVPGNDDALRAIKLYTNKFASAVLVGIESSLASSNFNTPPLPSQANKNQTAPKTSKGETSTKATTNEATDHEESKSITSDPKTTKQEVEQEVEQKAEQKPDEPALKEDLLNQNPVEDKPQAN